MFKNNPHMMNLIWVHSGLGTLTTVSTEGLGIPGAMKAPACSSNMGERAESMSSASTAPPWRIRLLPLCDHRYQSTHF